MINYLAENGLSNNFIEAIKSKWSIIYDDAKLHAVGMSAQLEAYNTTLNDLTAQIDETLAKQAGMDPESEGYAAYQIVIDRYKDLASKLRVKIDDFTRRLTKQ